ncbi:MAG: metal ABC transporter permease, partial [Chloroflexota bacterium]
MDFASLWSLLVEPFQYAFIRRGLIEALLMGALCGALGAFIVARGWGFIGDAISHAIFPGVVIAYLARFNVALGALLFGVLTALGIGALSHSRRLKEDTAIGVLFAGAFALGVVLLSSIRSYATDLGAILFGNILGVSEQDLWVTFALGVVIVAILYLTYKELLLVAFDRTMAAAMGLRVAWYDQLLLLLLTLTIIVSLQAVGNILVVAMLITPAACARLFADRFHHLMGLGALIGALCGVVGLYASYYLNLASGGVIVLLATVVFGVCFVCAPRHGVVAAWRRGHGRT